MPIPSLYKGRFVYQFTHLQNLPDILNHGLLSYNEKERLHISHVSIAEDSIQKRRATMQVTCGPGGFVHDYVPFYFSALSPMLQAVVHKKNVDQQFLIHLAVPISVLDDPTAVFTDASANTKVPPTFYSDPVDLAKLRWDQIQSCKWTSACEADKHARMAEALVHERLDVGIIDHIIVWNDGFGDVVKKAFKKAGIPCPAIVDDGYQSLNHYFMRPPFPSTTSLVTGPYFTRKAFEDTVKFVCAGRTGGVRPRFPKLGNLLSALERDFAVLPETAELVGLETDNTVHKQDVGTHSLKVVDVLVASPEYVAFTARQQRLAKLAAFLHDIGKGPKARWVTNGGRQRVDPDHPIESVRMLKRILTEEVDTVSAEGCRSLCKLVCYHDLVGDIVAKGRDEKQLVAVAEVESDLDMLIGLGKADMTAVNPIWGGLYAREIGELHDRVLPQL